MRHTVNGYLPLRHCFKQAGLRAWRGAVDFVGKDHIGKQRAGAEFKLALLEIVKIDAGDVARRYIGRKLNAAEAAARGACEGTQQHGLACTGDVLKQHMAAAEIAGGDQRQLLPLSENRLRAGVYEPVVPRNEAIGIHSLPSDFFFSIIARQKGNVNELFCETE